MKNQMIKLNYIKHEFCKCYDNEFEKRILECADCSILNEFCHTCKGTKKQIKTDHCR